MPKTKIFLLMFHGFCETITIIRYTFSCFVIARRRFCQKFVRKSEEIRFFGVWIRASSLLVRFLFGFCVWVCRAFLRVLRDVGRKFARCCADKQEIFATLHEMKLHLSGFFCFYGGLIIFFSLWLNVSVYFEVGFVYLAVHTALRLGFVVGRICRARSEWPARLQNSPLSAFSGPVSGVGQILAYVG